MITLNDYLYEGHTVLSILHHYNDDLRAEAIRTHNPVDLIHCNFLVQLIELLEHNYFLTDQSRRIQGFYAYMAEKYPYLAFTFKGRIKSLLRAEAKFNGYVVEYVTEYYRKNGTCPTVPEIKQNLKVFRDLIAYRIVIQIPRCHLAPGETQAEAEERILFELANALPEFLEERSFTAVGSGVDSSLCSPLLSPEVRPYYRDYVTHPRSSGYRSLHITFYDNKARDHIEIQLRTKDMDDYAEIGGADHQSYEQQQAESRFETRQLPEGLCSYYDAALIRSRMLQNLDLSKVDVSMFGAVDNKLINDGCGFYRGRLILPFEHLSSFQTDSAQLR